MIQQKNHFFRQNSFLILQNEERIEPVQFRAYLTEGKPWMLSQFFKDSSQQQFQQNLVTFFKDINQKNSQIVSLPEQNYLKQNYNGVQLDMEKLQNVAQLLKIKLQTVELTTLQSEKPIIKSLAQQNNQKAIIIIEKQMFSKNISYMFGLQKCSQVNQIIHNFGPNQFINCLQPQTPQHHYFLQQPQFSQNPQPGHQFLQKFQPTPQFLQKFQPTPQFLQKFQPTTQFLQRFQPILQNPQLTPITTPNQNIVLNTEFIQPEKVDHIIPKLLITPLQLTLVKCQICWEDYDMNPENQIILPCCGEKVHKKCTQEGLANSQELKCLFCKKTYDIRFLKENLSLATFQEKARKLVSSKYFEACFSCNAKIQVLPKQKIKVCKIQCNNCDVSICSKCMKTYHGEESICLEIRQEVIQLLQGQTIIVCPFCDLIQTKDEGCNHVTCSQCGNDLCSVCSVDRRPILSHGNHFHRKGCCDFREITGYDNKSKEKKRDCQLCKESNDGYCHFPKDLEAYRKEKMY